MATLGDYRGILALSTDGTGAGAIGINSNFKELANRAGPVKIAASAPTANDDGANTGENGSFYTFSHWIDTSTSPRTLYVCVDNATGAAVWQVVVGHLGNDGLRNQYGDPVISGTQRWTSFSNATADTSAITDDAAKSAIDELQTRFNALAAILRNQFPILDD